MNNNDFTLLGVDFECSACKKLKNQAYSIPVARIIQKLDSFFDTNDLSGAVSLLEYWQDEAYSIGDLSGELSVVNEMLGLYRKTSSKEKAEKSILRSLELIDLTNSGNSISGATIILNAATTCKAFGNAEKAISLYERATEIYKNQGLSHDDLRYAALYNNYATALVDLRRFEKAKDLYDKAVALTEKSITSLLDCAVTYVNMAHLYEAWQGFDSEHIEYYLSSAEDILKNQEIERNAYYAFVCEKCAPSFDYFGHFILAQELRDASRKIYAGA